MKVRFRASSLAFLLLVAGPLAATPSRAGDQEKESSSGLIPVALPFSTPDTGWGIGGALLYYSYDDPDLPPDELTLLGAYTERKQATIGLEGRKFFLNHRYLLEAEAGHSDFPSLFWGIGNSTPDEAEEEYTPVTTYLKASYQKQFGKIGRLGPRIEAIRHAITDVAQGASIEGGEIPGSSTRSFVGFGLHGTRDTRDSVFHPLKGSLTDVKAIGFVNRSASPGFFRLDADWRYFRSFLGEHVTALQVLFRHTSGDPPFQEMGALGGDVIMRGYPDRRYVDRNSLAAQIEYRSPPLWRLSGVAFVSAGKVFDELSHVTDGPLHIGWGLGVRFVADQEQHVPLRLDVGIDENGGAGVYFLITEAF